MAAHKQRAGRECAVRQADALIKERGMGLGTSTLSCQVPCPPKMMQGR